VVAVVILAAIGFILYKGLTSALVYFETASQAVAHRGQLANSTFQIEGVVVPGTLHALGPTALDFAISSGKVTVPVVDHGQAPPLFQACVPVVLVGHFVGATDSFSSDQIIIKHSNSYVAAHPGRVRAPTHCSAT
jgi:cytochrome c-type biogenesis protein CcmE